MKNTLKTIALSSVLGACSGFLTVFFGCYLGYVFWSGVGVASFAVALCSSIALAHNLRWLRIDISKRRLLRAAILIASIYPISQIAVLFTAVKGLYFTPNMRGSLAFDLFSYSRLFREPISGVFDERGALLRGLTLSVIIGAVLLAISLRVIARRWDRVTLVLMVLALPLTPLLNAVIAFGFRHGPAMALEAAWNRIIVLGLGESSLTILKPMYPEPVLFCENDVLLQIFPLGNAVFCALSLVWIKRASPYTLERPSDTLKPIPPRS